MLALINFLNRIFAVFSAAALLFTGGINSVFSGDVYKYESTSSVIGLESLVRAQGVTTDGESFIFSGKNALEKTDLEGREILALNTSAIPAELSDNFGSAHIGGISYADGKIYAPLEDSKKWQHPIIALYDSETLLYTGVYYELPKEIQKRGVPWVAVNAAEGLAFTSDSRGDGEIFIWSLEDFSYLGSVTPESPIKSIQGGEYYDGLLYLATNDETRAVYSLDINSGETVKLFDRIAYQPKCIDNAGGEGEDLTILVTEGGAWLHTLQTGALFIDVTLRHYK